MSQASTEWQPHHIMAVGTQLIFVIAQQQPFFHINCRPGTTSGQRFVCFQSRCSLELLLPAGIAVLECCPAAALHPRMWSMTPASGTSSCLPVCADNALVNQHELDSSLVCCAQQ